MARSCREESRSAPSVPLRLSPLDPPARQREQLEEWFAQALAHGFPDLLGQSVIDVERELPLAGELRPQVLGWRRIPEKRIVGGGWASLPGAWRSPGGRYPHLAGFPDPERLRRYLHLLLGWENGEVPAYEVWDVAGYLISAGDDHYLYAARLLGRREVLAFLSHVPYREWLREARVLILPGGRFLLEAPDPSGFGRRCWRLSAEQMAGLRQRFPLPAVILDPALRRALEARRRAGGWAMMPDKPAGQHESGGCAD